MWRPSRSVTEPSALALLCSVCTIGSSAGRLPNSAVGSVAVASCRLYISKQLYCCQGMVMASEPAMGCAPSAAGWTELPNPGPPAAGLSLPQGGREFGRSAAAQDNTG